MRVFEHKIPISVAVILFLSFSFGFAADKKFYPVTPPAQAKKKWRIGYLEGGPYKDYRRVLTETVRGLSELGWIGKISIPEQENKEDNQKLWAWLAVNAKSGYIEFAADAFYSDNWNKELREQTKKLVIRRLNEARDIDLMIAYGTWAGQDLANNDHHVPTIVCSVSDAVASGIVRSVDDSGYDHVHARLDPTRFERQIRAFHYLIGFRKLGVAFEDTYAGRSYAAIGDIEKVAVEKKFEVIKCPFIRHDLSKEAMETEMIKCANDLAPKIDAFYITINTGVTQKSLPKILKPMNANKIPTFSQSGADDVRHGVLLSVAFPNFDLLGRFHAEVIAKVINGAKPRELPQVLELPAKSAFNAATAKIIGLKPELYDLLLRSSVEIYHETEGGK